MHSLLSFMLNIYYFLKFYRVKKNYECTLFLSCFRVTVHLFFKHTYVPYGTSTLIPYIFLNRIGKIISKYGTVRYRTVKDIRSKSPRTAPYGTGTVHVQMLLVKFVRTYFLNIHTFLESEYGSTR